MGLQRVGHDWVTFTVALNSFLSDYFLAFFCFRQMKETKTLVTGEIIFKGKKVSAAITVAGWPGKTHNLYAMWKWVALVAETNWVLLLSWLSYFKNRCQVWPNGTFPISDSNIEKKLTFFSPQMCSITVLKEWFCHLNSNQWRGEEYR